MSKRIQVKLSDSVHSELMKKIRYSDNSSFQEFASLCVKAYLSGKLSLESLKEVSEQ